MTPIGTRSLSRSAPYGKQNHQAVEHAATLPDSGRAAAGSILVTIGVVPSIRLGIACAVQSAMDVDRKKHDVDVIERVLGGVRDPDHSSETSTRLLDVEVPWFGGSMQSTVEMMVGFRPEPEEDDQD